MRRDPNMVYNEKHILLELIEKYFGVIENKKTDAVSVGKKNEVWEKIRIEFNSQTLVPRTTDTLKNTWKNLKADARKKAAEERQSQMKTGGGPYPVIHIEPIFMEVLELIQSGAVVLLNPFDSDGAFDNGKEIN
ncbi:unnamed protein product [Callosobruchus maculatus]|uniref:Regulatory protein zeste n=1 Tax=Callosobruchus maculatus TaxID=64391 RepID=A0A653C4U7_CALMS|nr:unnamed protein product [Callosobruchus maculatus]